VLRAEKIAKGLEASPGTRKFLDIRINELKVTKFNFLEPGTVNYYVPGIFILKIILLPYPVTELSLFFLVLKVELFKLRNGFSFGLPPVLRIRIRRIHMFLGLLDPGLLVTQRYMSGSGSFYHLHQAKMGRKTLIPTVL
jgi:hypothetical protein